MTAIDTLKNLGFTEDDTAEFQQISDNLDLSRNDNPHKVLHVLTKGDVTAVIEKNVSDDNSGGVEVTMKHPAVLILESSKGRVAISNHDEPDNADLIAEVAGDLA